MSRWPKLSEETIQLRINEKAWEFWLTDTIKINTDDQKLALSFGKEVLLKTFNWDLKQK